MHLCSINAEEDAKPEGGRERAAVRASRTQKGSERGAAVSDVIDTRMDKEMG